MPNYVQHNASLSGSSASLKRLLEAIKDDDEGLGSIDFNKIVPMPESLNVESGSRTSLAIVWFVSEKGTIPTSEIREIPVVKNCVNNRFSKDWVAEVVLNCRRGIKEGWFDSNEYYELGRTYVNNYNQYGAPTWYEWCTENWGTKWNACDCAWDVPSTVSEMTEPDAEASCEIRFQTAWSTPTPVMLRLSEMFPDVKIRVEYADEDLGANCGKYELLGGNILEDVEMDDCDDAFVFACNIWGYDPDEMRADYEDDEDADE